jgi:hypothetical protein
MQQAGSKNRIAHILSFMEQARFESFIHVSFILMSISRIIHAERPQRPLRIHFTTDVIEAATAFSSLPIPTSYEAKVRRINGKSPFEF